MKMLRSLVEILQFLGKMLTKCLLASELVDPQPCHSSFHRKKLKLVGRPSDRPYDSSHHGSRQRLKRRVRKKSKTQTMEYTKMEDNTSAENMSSNEEDDKMRNHEKRVRRDSSRDPRRDPNAVPTVISGGVGVGGNVRKRVPSQSKESMTNSMKDGGFIKMTAESPTSPMPSALLQEDEEHSVDAMDEMMRKTVVNVNETGTFREVNEVAIIQSDDELEVEPMNGLNIMDEDEEDEVISPEDDDHKLLEKLKNHQNGAKHQKVGRSKVEEEEKLDFGWNNGSDEEEDTVGPLLNDDMNVHSVTMRIMETPLETPNGSDLEKDGNGLKEKRGVKPQVHYSESVQYGQYGQHHNQHYGQYGQWTFGRGLAGGLGIGMGMGIGNGMNSMMDHEVESDSEPIYDYHREQISTFLAPMRDIRIPKRRLEDFVDKIVDFTLGLDKVEDDSILDSIFEPIQRMDVAVSEILVKHLFLRAFERESAKRPIDENDSGYTEWTVSKMKTFYFHAPTLHLMAMIYTNRGIMRKEYAQQFHSSNNEFAIGLDKVIIATIYLVDDQHLKFRSFEVVLYLLVSDSTRCDRLCVAKFFEVEKGIKMKKQMV